VRQRRLSRLIKVGPTGPVRPATNWLDRVSLIGSGLPIWTRSAGLLPADQPELRISLMSCEVTGLIMARYVIGPEPLASLPPEAVVTAIAPTLQRLLAGPAPGA
jgi:hypothetical protein